MRPILLTMLITATLGLAACGTSEDETLGSTSPDAAAAASTPTETPDASLGAAGTTAGTSATTGAESAPKAGSCADVAAPAAKDADVSKPSGSLTAGKKYLVTLKTSCGSITIQLDQANNPKTANAFAHLVKEKYYDGTAFHRVVPGFVIQGGDPTGTGAGGPSWKVVEAPKSNAKYTAGVVAMAKTGADAPGTSQSQFFIVTGADTGLPPEYAIAGKVTAGQDIADLISAQGTQGADGPPNKPVVLQTATLKEQ